MANFKGWGAGGNKSGSTAGTVDFLTPAYTPSESDVATIPEFTVPNVSIGTGGVSGLTKAPTQTELKAQQAAQENQAIADNTARYTNYFQNFAQGKSITAQEEELKRLKDTVLPAELDNNAAFQANPEMRQRQIDAVTFALQEAYDANQKAIDDSSFWGGKLPLVGKQFADRMYGAKAVALNAYDEGHFLETAKLSEQEDALGRMYQKDPTRLEMKPLERILKDPNMSAEAKALAQKRIAQLQNDPNLARAQAEHDAKIASGEAEVAQTRAEIAQKVAQLTPEQREQAEQNKAERALDLARERQKTADYEQNLMETNADYANEVYLQEELKAQDPEGYLVGLMGNPNKARRILSLAVDSAPDMAMIAGAYLLGRRAPGVGKVLGTTATAISVLGGISDQAIQEVMNAPQETVEKNSSYASIRDRALKLGATAEEADKAARVAIALNATQDHALEALGIGIIESKIGAPGSLGRMINPSQIARASISSEAKLGLLHGVMQAGKSLAKTGFEEGVSELAENAEALNIANEALGTNTSLLKDWKSTFATAALVGAVFGAPEAAGKIAHSVRGSKAKGTTQTGTNQPTAQSTTAPGSSTASASGTTTAQGATATTGNTAGTTATQETATATQETATATQNTTASGKTMQQDLMSNAQNTPFYRSLDAKQQADFNAAGNSAYNVVQRLLSDKKLANAVDANALTDEEAVALYDAFDVMEALRGQTSDTNASSYIDNYIARVNESLKSQGHKGLLTRASIEERALNVLNKQSKAEPIVAPTQTTQAQPAPQSTQTTQAQPAPQSTQTTQAQPAPQPIQGATNANQGTDQGASASTGSTANTQQGTINTAGQQNTAPASGSGATAEGSGTGRSTHTDTGTPAQDVHSAEPENGGTGQGTDSGRDSSSNAEVSPQPDTGTGSTPSQTEQRSGSDTDTEATGTDRAARPAVRDRQVNEYAEAYSAYERVKERFAHRDMTVDAAIRSASGSAVMGDLNTNLLLNMQVLLENALGRACGHLFRPTVINTQSGATWYQLDASGKWVHPHFGKPKGKVRASLQLDAEAGVAMPNTRGNHLVDGQSVIFLNRDNTTPATLMHEMLHATLTFLRANKDELYSQAQTGNPYAKQLTDAIDSMAKALSVKPDAVLELSRHKGLYRNVQDQGMADAIEMNLEETIARQFEMYLLEHGYSDIYNGTHRGEEFANARHQFAKTIAGLTKRTLDIFTNCFISACKLLGLASETGANQINILGHAFSIKTSTGSRERAAVKWLREYGQGTINARAQGVDANMLPFFDSLAKGLSSLTDIEPIAIDNLDTYQTHALIEATAAELATQYTADGMTVTDAFNKAHAQALAMFREQQVVDRTIQACHQMSASSSNLSSSLNRNREIRNKRRASMTGDVEQAMLAVDINTSLNLMGYTADATSSDAGIYGTMENDSVVLAQPDVGRSSKNPVLATEQIVPIVSNIENHLYERILGAIDGTGAHDPIAQRFADILVNNVQSSTGVAAKDVLNTLFDLHRSKLSKIKGDASSQLYSLLNYDITGEAEALLGVLRADPTKPKGRDLNNFQAVYELVNEFQSFHTRVAESTYAYTQGLRAVDFSDNHGKSLSDAMLAEVKVNNAYASAHLDAMKKDQRANFNNLAKSANGDVVLQEILARNCDWFSRGMADRATIDVARAQLQETAKPKAEAKAKAKTKTAPKTVAQVSTAQMNASTAVTAALNRKPELKTEASPVVQNVTASKAGQANAIVADQIQGAMQRLYDTGAVTVDIDPNASQHAVVLRTIYNVFNKIRTLPAEQLKARGIELRQTILDMESKCGISPEQLFNAKNWTVFATNLGLGPFAFVPNFNMEPGNSIADAQINAITDSINQIVTNAYYHGMLESDPIAQNAWSELTTQQRVNNTVNKLAEAVGPKEAERLVKRAVELNNKPVDEALADIHSKAAERIKQESASNQLISDVMTEGEPNNEIITDLMITEQEAIDAQAGIVDPDAVYISEHQNSTIEAVGNPVNPSGVDAQLTDIQEAQARAEIADQIVDTIADTTIRDNIPSPHDTTTAEFKEWFADGGLTQPDGTPQMYYVSGNVASANMSIDPDACEVLTYVRANRVLDLQELRAHPERYQTHYEADRNMSASTVNELIDAVTLALNEHDYSKLAFFVRHGNPYDHYEGNPEEEHLFSIGNFDALDLGHGQLWLLNPESQCYFNHSLPPAPQDVATVGSGPQTMGTVADKITQMVMDQHQNYLDRAHIAQEQRDKEAASTIAMTPAQKAGMWHRMATAVHTGLVAASGAFRSWTQLNLGAAVGSAESNPLYMSFINMRQRIQGARTTLENNVITPFTDWTDTIADELGADRTTVATELAKARTMLHIIEAGARQEYELSQAVADAYASVEPDPEKRAQAIAEAEDNLNLYHQAQNGATHVEQGSTLLDTKEYPVFPLYGGMTMAQASTEYQNIVAKYGIERVDEAVKRLGRSIETMVNYGIDNGVFSQQDVANFGMWQYYTPLITKTNYEQGITNDVISLTQAKMNWHRGGSLEPAVDGFTALVYTATRMANNAGIADFSQNIYNAYQNLEARHAQHEVGILQAKTKIAGVDVTYYNGLAMVPARQLFAIAANENRSYVGELVTQAQRAIDKAAASVQVIIPDANNPNGSRTERMLVMFNDQAMGAIDGEGTQVQMDSHREQHQVIYDAFHRDATQTDAPQTKLGKAVGFIPKLTSKFASLCTVYNPFFQIISYNREAFERSISMTNKTLRDANGKPINSAKLTGSYGKNLVLYTKAAYMFALTGKLSDPNSKFGKYAQEASELGLLTSGTLVKAMDKQNAETLVLMQKYLGKLEQTDDVRESRRMIRDLISKGVGGLRASSEAMYAPSLMSAYIAMREAGMDKRSALYQVTEFNNTNQEGKWIKKLHLSALYPFVRTIMQSAGQISDFFGVNAMSFGQSAQSAKQHKRMAKSGAIVGTVTMGFAATIPLLAMALGGGDEDKGYKILDQLSLQSLNYMPIPIGPNGEHIKFQLGFGILPSCLQIAMGINRLVRGVATIPEVALSVVSGFINNLSLVGGPTYDTNNTEDFIKKMTYTLSPMLAQPLVGVATGKTYSGINIAPAHDQGTERHSDYNKRVTPESYRDIAKFIYDWTGIDAYPETYRAMADGYLIGPLRAITSYLENDPMAKDPAYKSTRETVGPVGTLLGITGGYSAAYNVEKRDMYNFANMCNNVIKDNGIHKAMTLKKGEINPLTGEKFTASTKREFALTRAGFPKEFVQDFMTVYNAGKEIKKVETEYREAIKTAQASHASEATYASLARKYNIILDNMYKNASRSLSYGKTYGKGDIRGGEQRIKMLRMQSGQGEE